MKNAVKKLAENQTSEESKTAIMQILKPEVQETKEEVNEEVKEEPKPVININEVIKKVNDQFYLTEQHANLTNQINKLNNFRSRINTSTGLMLTNGGGEASFSSNDPAAVETLISICIGNIQDRINTIESKLLAA